MKKFLILILSGLAVFSTYAQDPEQKPCRTAVECDSLDIPVFIVDGVEVQDIDGISRDDIVKVEITKDPAITGIFRPRLGGVVLITTKSKKYLKPLLKKNAEMTERQKRQRIPGQLLLR